MLSNFIMVIMAVYIAILPFLMTYVLVTLLGNQKTEPITILPKRKNKRPKMSEQERRTRDILANIDAYDGSSNGQRPVKE